MGATHGGVNLDAHLLSLYYKFHFKCTYLISHSRQLTPNLWKRFQREMCIMSVWADSLSTFVTRRYKRQMASPESLVLWPAAAKEIYTHTWISVHHRGGRGRPSIGDHICDCVLTYCFNKHMSYDSSSSVSGRISVVPLRKWKKIKVYTCAENETRNWISFHRVVDFVT